MVIARSAKAEAFVTSVESAARHLFIWGHRPDGRGRVRSRASQPELARVQTLLGGY